MEKNLTPVKPTIVFDFDNTLFDSMQLKSLFGGIAAVNGFNEAQAREFYAAARNETDGIIAITLERYVEEVRRQCAAQKKKYDEKATRDVVLKIKNQGAKLFLPGARPLLDFCRVRDFQFYLLSLGVRDWQLEKMRWVGLDKIFNDENTVFTVKENGGKIEALRELFGNNFTGANTILFNDRADESAELLKEFDDLVVFLRRDERDDRSSNKKMLAEMIASYDGRVIVADNLTELLEVFQNYVK